MNFFIIRLLIILFFACFCSLSFWYYIIHSHATPTSPHITEQNPAKTKENASTDKLLAQSSSKSKDQKKKIKSKSDKAPSGPGNIKQNPAKSKDFSIDPLLENYTPTWKKQEMNLKSYRSSLGKCCNAVSNAVVTQHNSPLGSNINYDGVKKTLEVKPALFDLFPKENPFKKAPWDSCAVVGNGGILANSGCGKQIDSAKFVIRCNLPPLGNKHERDAGSKTHLVTANPSIFYEKYSALNERRVSFVKDMELYGDALLLLPAFSFHHTTGVSFRALYSLQDLSKSGPQAVFFNPSYLINLTAFWRGQGIRAARLSTGIMMASLALELCNNVHLYGFWPFGTHPYTHQEISNHYYDNRPANPRMHAMPAEFKALLNLHNKGVIHLHLGMCTN